MVPDRNSSNGCNLIQQPGNGFDIFGHFIVGLKLVKQIAPQNFSNELYKQTRLLIMARVHSQPLQVGIVFEVIKSLFYPVTELIGDQCIVGIFELGAENGEVPCIDIPQLGDLF